MVPLTTYLPYIIESTLLRTENTMLAVWTGPSLNSTRPSCTAMSAVVSKVRT